MTVDSYLEERYRTPHPLPAQSFTHSSSFSPRGKIQIFHIPSPPPSPINHTSFPQSSFPTSLFPVPSFLSLKPPEPTLKDPALLPQKIHRITKERIDVLRNARYRRFELTGGMFERERRGEGRKAMGGVRREARSGKGRVLWL